MDNKLIHKYKFRIISFYILIILLLLGWISLSLLFAYWILSSEPNDSRLWVIAVFPIIYALIAVMVFICYKPQGSRGISVTEKEIPNLMNLIKEVADKIGYRGVIDEVVLTPGISVGVSYNSKLKNLLLKSKATLYIGVYLCRILSNDELRAVIAHELAHFSQPQTKYKAYLARLSNISSKLGKNGVFGGNSGISASLFGLYTFPARLFCKLFKSLFEIIFNVNSAEYLEVTTEMEIEADSISAQICGADNMLSALCKSYSISQRVLLYKTFILPYLSSFGYRCDGFWNTFEAVSPLFESIDGLNIRRDKQLNNLKQKQFDLSECTFVLRLDSLEKLTESLYSELTGSPLMEFISTEVKQKMDDFLCKKYHQTIGLSVGEIRLNEFMEDLRSSLFNETHSMAEAFDAVNTLIEELINVKSYAQQVIKPEYEVPSFDVVPKPFLPQVSETIYSSSIELCPVCGHKINEDTKMCPHCKEQISE